MASAIPLTERQRNQRPGTDALLVAMSRLETVSRDGRKFRSRRWTLLAERLAKLACDGEPWAVKEVLDRCEGRPAQRVEGSLGGAIVISWLSENQDSVATSVATEAGKSLIVLDNPPQAINEGEPAEQTVNEP